MKASSSPSPTAPNVVPAAPPVVSPPGDEEGKPHAAASVPHAPTPTGWSRGDVLNLFYMALAAAVLGGGYLLTHESHHPNPGAHAAASAAGAAHENESVPGTVPAGAGTSQPAPSEIVFAQVKWSAAGIATAPAEGGGLTESVWRSGRLVLNEERIAHLAPTASGAVREVRVRLGKKVAAGEVLAVLDSREVGEAKLDLARARVQRDFARAQHEWTHTIGENAGAMVEAMRKGAPLKELDPLFKDKPIGDLRQQLVTAYSRRQQTKAHYEAVGKVEGAVAQSTTIKLQADYEAADAQFWGLCEEVKFQTAQQIRLADQKLREAETTVGLCETQLYMIGFTKPEVAAMDPVKEGADASYYPIRAPFAGTILDMHAVRAERVGPTVQMFQIADLSTLWLKADVYENDLPMLHGLESATVRFRLPNDSGTPRTAEVFFRGEVVDPQTRAAALVATAENPDGALRSGAFVEVELTRRRPGAVHVPATAILRQGKDAFVFVHVEGDRFRRVDVQCGAVSGDRVEIVKGLSAKDQIVVQGGFALKSEMLKDLMGEE